MRVDTSQAVEYMDAKNYKMVFSYLIPLQNNLEIPNQELLNILSRYTTERIMRSSKKEEEENQDYEYIYVEE
ncbi:MAG: hypothetical protein IIW92_12540 [Lachnospiraceae bacterium]|nr:hypothetical protein [Lachnospiraceae bacterium]MBQ5919382.1 hypothetical protein [Lachnospiraceae bacterium]